MPEPTPRFRVGADIGGTFTDVVLSDGQGRSAYRKVPSTPDDFGRAIVEAVGLLVGDLGLDPSEVAEVIHGTTIATNAILERRGARTGLLTTRGFRDTLEIGRLRYPRMYDLTWSKPLPLVERRWRFEVDERLDRDGNVVEPLDEIGARRVVERLIALGVDSIAVCLLHSYKNPAHERALGRIVAEVAPGMPLSLSSDVLPEIGEYERTSTTVINAYLQPVVGRYLGSLKGGLARVGVSALLSIMQSNGGIMSATAASERPIHIVESGPAAGVIAARDLARQQDLANVITLDMGGTTAKASAVENGQLHQASEYEVGSGLNVGNRLNRGAGYLLRVPAIDIAEVGAGGGSIVWLDPAGSVHVGPRSAGAVPGPVCYRLGGTEPTLTDANVLLGYLNPTTLLGGTLPIDRGHAESVFQSRIAAPLGLNLMAAAYGVHRIAVASMVRVVKAVSSERGRDPRAFTLVAFGGNGPVHGALVASELGMSRILIPPRPGLFSAIGLLVADVAHHFSRAILRPTTTLSSAELALAYEELEAMARTTLTQEGHSVERIRVDRSADVRYVGQSFELRIPLEGGNAADFDPLDLERRFGLEHERTYGHRADGDAIELVNARLTATVLTRSDKGRPIVDRQHFLENGRQLTDTPWRPAYFGMAVGLVRTPVVDRWDVGPDPISGPLIIEEYDATTVVPPGFRIWRDQSDNLVLAGGGDR